MRLALAVASLILLAAAAPAPRPVLGPIRAQLYYETLGTLSPNIAPPARFDGWNTIIGEGDAQDSARDLLVTVPLSLSKGGDMGINSDIPLVITATDGKGRVLGRRRVDNILIPYRGEARTGLWLNDVTCKGRVTITAAYGAQTRRTQVALDCGE